MNERNRDNNTHTENIQRMSMKEIEIIILTLKICKDYQMKEKTNKI